MYIVHTKPEAQCIWECTYMYKYTNKIAITIGQCSKIYWKFQARCQELGLQRVAHVYFVSLDAIKILPVEDFPVACQVTYFAVHNGSGAQVNQILAVRHVTTTPVISNSPA